MRPAGTYRGFRRNVLRAAGNLRHWRSLGVTEQANEKAKLPERAKQCEQARMAMSKAVVGSPFRKAGVEALQKFWFTQMPTRVVSRILRGLKAELRAA